MLQISELYIYPIKSLPGIPLKQALITERGFEYDRRWMLVDENDRFISQRECPEMTQLFVSVERDGLKVTSKISGASLIIPFETPASASQVIVTVWDDMCDGEFVSMEADKWFSKALGINCRLVYMPDNSRRPVEQPYARQNSITSFSDAYPYMIIGQASLDELNRHLAAPLPMNRFRPNMVFIGGAPFAEDTMAHFTIAGINFYGVKLCARCPIPTIDQQTGTRGKEPLKTLASYRFKNNKIYFGQNLVHEGEGVISVGDSVQTISFNTDERFMIGSRAEKIS